MGGWKRLIFGEEMPDRNDPKYKQRYENEVAAGQKTAKFLRIDKAVGWLQRFACRNPKWFLAIAFGIVIGCFALNIYRMATYYHAKGDTATITATEHQEQILKQKRIQK